MKAKIPERLLRCRRRAAAATCPLADPDTVANISFGIGTGRRAAQPRVLSAVLRPHVAGNKME
jgi:hypothetical protein